MGYWYFWWLTCWLGSVRVQLVNKHIEACLNHQDVSKIETEFWWIMHSIIFKYSLTYSSFFLKLIQINATYSLSWFFGAILEPWDIVGLHRNPKNHVNPTPCWRHLDPNRAIQTWRSCSQFRTTMVSQISSMISSSKRLAFYGVR